MVSQARDFFENIKSTLKPCARNWGYTDPDLGIVTLDPVNYCNPRTLRFIKGLSCCAPQPPTSAFPRLLLYKPGTDVASDGQQLDWRNASHVNYLSDGPVVFLIHGWYESYNTSIWMQKAVEAWTKGRNRQVVRVDWTGDEGNKYYFQTAANVRTVGMVVGFALLHWNLTQRVTLVGNSCGAQAVGEAGQFVKRQTKGATLISQCLGLDPAGPGFDGGPDVIRLTHDDCRVVQVVHSSAETEPTSTGLFERKFGTYYKSGNCDFWINCGKYQGDGCKDPTFNQVLGPDGAVLSSTKENDFCSHHRAPLVFVSQVNRSCSLTGDRCLDCHQVRHDRPPDVCSSSRLWGQRLMPPDSRCAETEDSNFNVKTTAEYPYC